MTKKLNIEKGLFIVLGLIISLLAVLSFLPQKSNNRVYGAGDVQYNNYQFVGGNFLLDVLNNVYGYADSSSLVEDGFYLGYSTTLRDYPYFISCNINSVDSVVSLSFSMHNFLPNVNASSVTIFDFNSVSLSDGSSGFVNFYRDDVRNYQGLLYYSVDYNVVDSSNFFLDGVSNFSFVNAILPYTDLSIYDLGSSVAVYSSNSSGTYQVVDSLSLSRYTDIISTHHLNSIVYRYTYFDSYNNSITFDFSCVSNATPVLYSNRSYIFTGGDNYNNGYNAGFDAGVLSSSSDNYNSGYNNGYNAGKIVGNAEGYAEGLSASNTYTFNSLFGAVLDAPIQTLTGLLNFNLLGVNLLGLFTGLLTLAVIVFIVKLALGGK